MNGPSQHELLSAYLDGELTADEQVQVERLLANDPKAKRLLGELRALSATLQSLPQQKLGASIAEQVLRAAERRKRAAEAERPRPAAPAEPPRWRRMLNRRALTWTALTVAVAVVIVLNDPQRPRREKEVVKAPAVEDSAKNAPEPKIDPAKPGRGPEMRAAGNVNNDRVHELQKKRADELAAPSNGRRDKTSGHEKLTASMEPPARPAQHAAGEAKDGRPKMAEFYADGKPIPAGGRASPEVDELVKQDADAIMVVVCDVSAEAAQKQTFRQLLADNQIVWAEQPPEGNETATYDNDDPADDRTDGAAEDEKRQVMGRNLRLTESLARAGAAELVEVRATQAQIDATLDRLAALPEQFLSVSVEAGLKGDTRGRWDLYARRSSGIRKPDDPGAKSVKDVVPSPARGDSFRDSDLSLAVPAKRLEQATKETAAPGQLAQRGFARPLNRLDALKDAEMKAEFERLDDRMAKLESKPADALRGTEGKGGSLAMGRGLGDAGGGRSMEPPLAGQGSLPAERPAPADIVSRLPVAPTTPGVPASGPDAAKKPAATLPPVVEMAPKADVNGALSGVANAEGRAQTGVGGTGELAVKGTVEPKAEPAPPAVTAPAPPQPAAPQPGADLPEPRLAEKLPPGPHGAPGGTTTAASQLGKGKSEEAKAEGWADEADKQRKLAEKKKQGDYREKAVAEEALDRETVQPGKTFDIVPGEKRDASTPATREAAPSQPVPGSAATYAYGQKGLGAQPPLESTCRVLFVLRVVPTPAAEAKAAASLKEAAPKAEADAAREMPAVKSK